MTTILKFFKMVKEELTSEPCTQMQHFSVLICYKWTGNHTDELILKTPHSCYSSKIYVKLKTYLTKVLQHLFSKRNPFLEFWCHCLKLSRTKTQKRPLLLEQTEISHLSATQVTTHLS